MTSGCFIIKSALKTDDFMILKASKKNAMMAVKATPEQEFQKCFQRWQQQ
jgi:hypothetical protein